jgi:hypothetical protein
MQFFQKYCSRSFFLFFYSFIHPGWDWEVTDVGGIGRGVCAVLATIAANWEPGAASRAWGGANSRTRPSSSTITLNLNLKINFCILFSTLRISSNIRGMRHNYSLGRGSIINLPKIRFLLEKILKKQSYKK